jgi:azurin
LHCSYGAGSHFLLLRDEVAGQMQGAVVPLPGEFISGAHRGRFNPLDGQFYVSGMTGWGTYSLEVGCFHRVRFTGDRVQLPVGFHVYQNGVSVTFSEPIDRAVAEKAGMHFAQCWNYRYSGAYGSPEYSTRHQGVQGHDTLVIKSAHVLSGGRTLFLEIPDLQPVNQLHLRLYVESTGTAPSGRDLFATVHRLDKPFTKFQGYRPSPKTIAAHPILADLALATQRVPNPWRKPIAGARVITLKTGKNLSFATRTLNVRAGEPIRFILSNPDVVPHNWALIKPGTLRRVGEMTNRLVSGPSAFARHYIPKTSDVLVYTDVVAPKSKFAIHFHAPKTPGRYPFLCTFPGHWMVMNGELIVK